MQWSKDSTLNGFYWELRQVKRQAEVSQRQPSAAELDSQSATMAE
jgi:hypothetical protein